MAFPVYEDVTAERVVVGGFIRACINKNPIFEGKLEFPPLEAIVDLTQVMMQPPHLYPFRGASSSNNPPPNHNNNNNNNV